MTYKWIDDSLDEAVYQTRTGSEKGKKWGGGGAKMKERKKKKSNKIVLTHTITHM